MKQFQLCIHDATPAFATETGVMLKELAPRVGRRISLGVVPNWHGQWPLAAHPAYCRLIRDGTDELLLHGYRHERGRGYGPITWLAKGSDELNGLSAAETRRTIECGQLDFIAAFGEPARGFLAPAWQLGQVASHGAELGLQHVLGFFCLESFAGQRVPLTTWSWDCGRYGWLGHVGDGIGRVLHALNRGVPTLALHPRDLERGYWPRILRVVDELLDRGYEATTTSALLAS